MSDKVVGDELIGVEASSPGSMGLADDQETSIWPHHFPPQTFQVTTSERLRTVCRWTPLGEQTLRELNKWQKRGILW
jgi:hypothetical protein